MGAKGEAFAKQFEAKVEEAIALFEKLSDADWKKTTAAEKWTVAVAAHHIGRSYEPVTHIIETIALHKKAAAAAAAAVRGLSDAELAKTGTVFTGMPAMSAEEMVKRALLDHVD